MKGGNTYDGLSAEGLDLHQGGPLEVSGRLNHVLIVDHNNAGLEEGPNKSLGSKKKKRKRKGEKRMKEETFRERKDKSECWVTISEMVRL